MNTTGNTSGPGLGNPWKGLNFYQEGEILYGRDDEIQSLSLYVTNNTQTVLYGKSGIGKSSIINAGVFPIARREGLFPIPIRLKHDNAKSYTAQIKDAFRETHIGIREILKPIDEDNETLWEYLHRNTFYNPAIGSPVRPLIVLDQFEEIFTLQHDEHKKLAFFSELADLLNEITPDYIARREVAPAADTPVAKAAHDSPFAFDFGLADASGEEQKDYVAESLFNIVFTIREDFLSYLERYTKYIPVMKTNRYALLPINEEQAKDIIMRPVEGLIDINVAKLIIEKVTGRTDFTLGDEPEIDVDTAVLSLFLSRIFLKKDPAAATITASLVNTYSKDIISDFYEASVGDLPAAEIERLEDLLLTYDNRRDNVSYNDLVNEGISEHVIRTLVDDRKLLRQFSYQGDIRVEFMHDILCPVVNERIEQRESLRRDQEAKRQHEEERRRLIRKNRKRLIITGGLSASVLLLALAWWMMFRMPVSNTYADFIEYNGWPKGIGPELSGNDMKDMVVHYRLTRRGLWSAASNHYFKVEVLNRNGDPATNILKESPIVSLAETDGRDELSRSFAAKQLLVVSWLYTADEYGNVAHQTAFDADRQVLYAIQYYRETTDSASQDVQTLWMNYVDKEGKSLRLRGNGADRMRVTLRDGYYAKYTFYNETGTPQRNGRMAYGYRHEVKPDDGSLHVIIPLDEYGDSLPSQAIHFTQFDEYLRWTHADRASAEYGPDRIIFNMPDRTDSLLFDDEGRRIYRSEHIHSGQLRTFAYDGYGNLTRSRVFKINTTGAHTLTTSLDCTYLDSDSLLEKTEYTANAAVRFSRESHEYEKGKHTVTYYIGNDPDSLTEGNPMGKDYCRVVTLTGDTDTTRWAITTYYAFDNARQLTELRRVENHYLKSNGLPLRKIRYGAGRRTLSMEYEVEDNLVTGKHVVGINGDIIRCPEWDEDRLCYYQKKFVRNFAGDNVAARAVNEFGEASLITNDDYEIKISIAAGKEIIEKNDTSSIYGTGSFEYSMKKANPANQVTYLHITDSLGTFSRCHVHDGDILLSSTPTTLTVARPKAKARPNEPRYEKLTLQLQLGGDEGCHRHNVFLTEAEMQQLRAAIKN